MNETSRGETSVGEVIAGDKLQTPPKHDASRKLPAVTVALAIYAVVAIITQFFGSGTFFGVPSFSDLAVKRQRLIGFTNLIDFETAANPFDAACRKLDLALPLDARIYMDDMAGATNLDRALFYPYVAYYLFPREIATSLDRPALITRDGYVGRAAVYAQELLTNGFDVELSARSDTIKGRPLRDDLPLQPLISPPWFRSRLDWLIAFLLPLLCALSGLWLVKWVFPDCSSLPPMQRIACGFGLGMMAVAALTLGIKLAGFYGWGLVLLITAAGALLALWEQRTNFATGSVTGMYAALRNPITLPALLVFFLIFSCAGLLGIVESDAVGAWMLKAKIFHLSTGSQIIQWFSQPRLAHAHMDYPTLVPALHATTFDSIGHVDEYVTKFWPAWMLLLLFLALLSLQGARRRFSGYSFLCLALLLLPATRQYVLMEGGTMPMVFFVTWGTVLCAVAMLDQNRARLLMGLALLFGAAMAKFEGAIVLIAATGSLIITFWGRRKPAPMAPIWRTLGFCLLAAFPFVCLRLRIPALHYESGWAGYAFSHLGTTLSSIPGFLLMMTARWFVSPTLADWEAQGGHLHWIGHWDGFSSLYNHPTLGMAWVALGLTLLTVWQYPARRRLVFWLCAMIGMILLGFSTVFSAFVCTMDRTRALEYYTAEIASARYLFPILIAWAAAAGALLFWPDIPTGTGGNTETRSAVEV
ncbi:MAG TPA: hypothetical protein VL361_26610 [Candidatus Limnocylindrales bacterium]|nr:hypothetical protein [Candidatus Limnocylindrales bacterium]